MDEDGPCQFLADGKIHSGVCAVHSLHFFPVCVFQRNTFILKNKVRAADNDFFALQFRSDAMGNHILHFRMAFLMEQTFFRRLSDDGTGNAVGKMFFQTCRCPQHFIPFIIPKGNDLRNLRASFC